MPEFKTILREFAQDIKRNFSSRIAAQPEDQLKPGVQLVLKAAARQIETRTEVRADVEGRPDIGVASNRLLCGFVELKAPGKGARPQRFTGADKRQWEKFKALPNLIYTDGPYAVAHLRLTQLICGQFSEDTIPFAIRPTKRAASAPVSNGGKRRQQTCRNLSPFATAHLPPFAAFSRRLLSHGRLTPWLNQGFLSTHRPRSGQRVERC